MLNKWQCKGACTCSRSVSVHYKDTPPGRARLAACSSRTLFMSRPCSKWIVVTSGLYYAHRANWVLPVPGTMRCIHPGG